MGCVSSKILTKSGSFQEKVNHSFQRSNLIEEIILSNSKSNGDQFLALLSTSNSAARRTKDAEQSPQAAAELAKIETINVSELLAGLEEENTTAEEEEQELHQDGQKDQSGKSSSDQCASDGTAGRTKSFRTVEEFDALVTQSSSSEQAKPATLAPPEQDVSLMQSSSPDQEEARTAVASNQDAMAPGRSSSEQGDAAGEKRRARARQLGELKVPPAFDFSKSGSLRDWLLRGGQIFSPGSYVTPKFGNAAVASEHRGRQAGEQNQHAVFDPELVAQFEQAMEKLSVDEERVLKEIFEVMEAGEKAETERLERLNDQPVVVQN